MAGMAYGDGVAGVSCLFARRRDCAGAMERVWVRLLVLGLGMLRSGYWFSWRREGIIKVPYWRVLQIDK